jgi:hypothetical protein
MQQLLEILRGRISGEANGEAEWSAALELAAEEHVLPWTAACMRSQSTSLPPGVADRLDQIERDAAKSAFFWISELKGVLHAFHNEGIPAVPLKGPFLGERVYGSAALRMSRDLDVLVSKAYLARAEDALAAVGFIPGAADDYHRPWYRETTTVELHHDVENPLAFNFDVATALLRTRPAVFHGQPTWQLAPEDELLFLCLHAARHRFERLSLIVDIQLAFEKLPATVDGWQPRTETAELNSLLALGLAMARRLKPELAVAIPMPTSGNQHHLEMLADCLWHRLLTQPSEPLDWQAAHAFYLEIEPSAWCRFRRRYRHFRILLGRVIEPDYAFAARLGMRRVWQVRMLRPVRLLSESIKN